MDIKQWVAGSLAALFVSGGFVESRARAQSVEVRAPFFAFSGPSVRVRAPSVRVQAPSVRVAAPSVRVHAPPPVVVAAPAVVVEPPAITFEAPPPLVEVGGGIEVVSDCDDEVYFVNGWYWTRRDDHWFRTRSHRGGWAPVRRGVPRGLVVMPRGQYRNYSQRDRRHADARDNDRVIYRGHGHGRGHRGR